MALSDRLFRTAFRTVASCQTWRISLTLCIVLCVSNVYSIVIEFNVWLWNRIKTFNKSRATRKEIVKAVPRSSKVQDVMQSG